MTPGAFTTGHVPGSFFGGRLVEAWCGRIMLPVFNILAGIGLILFLPPASPLALLAALGIGALFGGSAPLMPAPIAEQFGADPISGICGKLMLAYGVAGAVTSSTPVFDYSCFTKYRVEGPGALAALNHICAGECDVPAGKIVYTQWLNPRGGIEADVTVIRLAQDAFLVVTLALSQRRDLAWFRRNIPAGAQVHISDVTSGTAMLAVMGPKARALMARVSPDDFSNEGFPFGTSREVDLGYARVRASRLTFVGELGFELLIDTEFAAHVYDVLTEAGRDLGLKPAGYFALNSLRMEKGYRHWGHDIGEEDTPFNAGLGFAVAMGKPDFIGKDALVQQKAEGPVARRLVQVRLKDSDHPPLMLHHEPILRDGQIVGSIMSGAYGHRLEASLGLGYVSHPGGITPDWLESGRFEVEIAMKRLPAEVQFGPWYDPKGERIRS